MSEVGDGAEEPDMLEAPLRQARPMSRDVVAELARSRVRARMFGRSEPVLVGRYTLEARLGAGSGGQVFLATDPTLSRKVALKLLFGSNPDRLLAEGQALARLSHPNVVPVYDTGRHGDQIYVVMELVTGATLRAYAASHTVRETVHAYRQAGAGLSAAHRAGFVHRDFKPDNALVGDDGRVRVVDFGLARASSSEGGAIGGTPGYMAPEQLAGGALSPAADQYAFCVSLREGVSARGEVPRWLDGIIRRGTAASPDARYPSMDALLAALARDPHTVWKRRGIIGGVAILAAATFVIGRIDRDEGPSCDPTAALGDAWNKRAVQAHLASLKSPYAPEAATQLVSMLDRYANSWRSGHRNACIAHRDGAQSSTLFDRRVACLTSARAALARASEVARTATDGQLADVILAANALPDLERCADPNALVGGRLPPRAIAEQVAALDHELAALEVEVRAARPDARGHVLAAVERARTLGYSPVLARAQRLAGRAAHELGLRSETIAPFTETLDIALRDNDRELAIEAFAMRMWNQTMDERTGAAADALVAIIQSIADGLPDHARAARAELANAIGGAALAAGARDRARQAFARAVQLSRGVTGPKALELAGALSNLALVTDDPATALALANERVAIVERGLGVAHPLSLKARLSAAMLEPHRARVKELLVPPCEQLAVQQPDQVRQVVECQSEVGWLAFERGDRQGMRRAFERVLDEGPQPGLAVRYAVARAQIARLDGDEARASQIVATALIELGSLDAAPWWKLLGAADLELAGGGLMTARRLLEQGLAANPLVHYKRRLAYVWARTDNVAAALAWYRQAGGYDDVIATLMAR